MSAPPLPPGASGTPVKVDEAAKTVPTPTSTTDKEAARPAVGAKAVQAAEWPRWEVFVRSKAGLDHKHCGSLHAADPKMAIQMARDVYTRRQEGTSIWVVRSDQIIASDPGDKSMYFDPAEDKVYRHPTFYKLPQAVDHM